MVRLPPTTAVVVIGRNEGERLVRCLQSLQRTGCPVIYVDSSSTDGSVETASTVGAKIIQLDLERPFTAARARAEGVAELVAHFPPLENVMFIDGDCELEEGFLDSAERFLLENSEWGAVCGRRRERFPEASVYNRIIDREWDTPIGEAEACGGDALFRFVAYHDAGGFNPEMIAGEEPELCARLRSRGWKVMRLDVPMTVHDAAMYRFSQWWRRAIRSGMGYAQAWNKTRSQREGRLYVRELARAIAWAGVLPSIAIILAVASTPWLLLLWPAMVLLQYLRLARRDGAFSGFLSIAGKYAELVGILRYMVRSQQQSQQTPVTYK